MEQLFLPLVVVQRNSQTSPESTKALAGAAAISAPGSVYYLNSSLTTLPRGEGGQTIFLPFTKQIRIAYLNVSKVYFSGWLNTFLCGVKQTVHFIRKANNLAREYHHHLRGTKLLHALCPGSWAPWAGWQQQQKQHV